SFVTVEDRHRCTDVQQPQNSRATNPRSSTSDDRYFPCKLITHNALLFLLLLAVFIYVLGGCGKEQVGAKHLCVRFSQHGSLPSKCFAPTVNESLLLSGLLGGDAKSVGGTLAHQVPIFLCASSCRRGARGRRSRPNEQCYLVN